MLETFGLLLVREGLIDREALYGALRLQKRDGGLLGTCLLRAGHLRRGPLLQALARHLKIPPAPPSRVLHPDPDLTRRFDPKLLARLRALPYARGHGAIYVAFADPRALPEIEALQQDARGEELRLRVAIEDDVMAGLAALDLDLDLQPALKTPEALHPDDRPAKTATQDGPSTLTADLPQVSRPDGERPERFLNQGEVAFAKATGFDEARTAIFRLDEIAAAADAGARAQAKKSSPATRAASQEPAAPATAFPGPVSGVSPVPASSPALPRPVFRNEDEVAFSQATGFDQERTAVFRLDQLAGEDQAKGNATEEEGLPAPPDAPRIAEAAEKLFEASNEGGVARQLVKFYSIYFPRVIVLTRHDQVLRGLLARGLDLSGPQVAQLRFPLGPFEHLFEERGGYYGPPPGGQELEPFYKALGETAAHALVVPIATKIDPPWLLFADHGAVLDRYDDVHELEMMAKEATVALDLLRARGPKKEAHFPPLQE